MKPDTPGEPRPDPPIRIGEEPHGDDLRDTDGHRTSPEVMLMVVLGVIVVLAIVALIVL